MAGTEAVGAQAHQVGFIGLGLQGEPMARRLLDAGWPLTVWARRAEVTEPYRERGAAVAGSPAELGATCDLVEVCLLDDAAVLEVVVDAGLLDAMPDGSVLAIHSTVHPSTVLRLDELATARGVRLLDAPISGGAPAAEVGALTVMVGGADDSLDYCRPAFSAFAGTISHLGGVGSGQLAKLVNNALFAANLAAADSALRLGESFGIPAAALLPVLQAGSSRGYALDVAGGGFGAPDGLQRAATLLGKDVRIVEDVAAERHLGPSFLLRTATAAMRSLGGEPSDS